MARSSISDEEILLRKRARRRLVGATALVLVAVAAVPILLDSEPRGAQPPLKVTMPTAPTTPSPSGPSSVEPAPQRPTRIEAQPPTVEYSSEPFQTAMQEPGAAADMDVGLESDALPVPHVPTASSDTPGSRLPPVMEKRAPEKVASSPGSAHSSAGKQAFVVQLIATSSPEKARELKRRLQQQKFPVYTEKTPDGDKTRVRVGPFAKAEAAEDARRRLVTLGFDPGKVVAKGE